MIVDSLGQDRESGATAVEYALILSVVCVLLLIILMALGPQVTAALQSALSSIPW